MCGPDLRSQVAFVRRTEAGVVGYLFLRRRSTKQWTDVHCHAWSRERRCRGGSQSAHAIGEGRKLLQDEAVAALDDAKSTGPCRRACRMKRKGDRTAAGVSRRQSVRPASQTLHDGDIVLVDLGRRMPTPPGIFVLHDGMGLVAKRLEHIPNSDPRRLRIISDNPLYKPYEGSGEEVNIIGRIRWFAREI